MKPNKEERQYRALESVAAVDEGKQRRIETEYYIEGYATTWESYVLYEDEGGAVYEKFDRSAFENTDMSDIIMQFDHGGIVFARNRNGTLIVEPDEYGLFVAADLSKTESARALYEDIAAGLIDRMSWGFRLGDYAYDKTTRTITHKSIKKIFDVSAVSMPANENTTISARSFGGGVTAKATEESRLSEIIKIKAKANIGEKHEKTERN